MEDADSERVCLLCALRSLVAVSKNARNFANFVWNDVKMIFLESGKKFGSDESCFFLEKYFFEKNFDNVTMYHISRANFKSSCRLIVRNAKKSMDLVSENISVQNKEVSTTGLSARPICDTSFRILPILFSPAFFKVEIAHSKSLTKLYQQCSIFASVSYSDATWEPLNDLDSSYFEMSAHSDNERALAVSHHASKVHVIAIDENWPLPVVEISLQSSAQCASTINGASPAALAVTVLNVPIKINNSCKFF